MAKLVIHSNDKDYPCVLSFYDPRHIAELDQLEEVLYIWWELTPGKRYWKGNLDRDGFTVFDYHMCEFASVQRIGPNEFAVSM